MSPARIGEVLPLSTYLLAANRFLSAPSARSTIPWNPGTSAPAPTSGTNAGRPALKGRERHNYHRSSIRSRYPTEKKMPAFWFDMLPLAESLVSKADRRKVRNVGAHRPLLRWRRPSGGQSRALADRGAARGAQRDQLCKSARSRSAPASRPSPARVPRPSSHGSRCHRRRRAVEDASGRGSGRAGALRPRSCFVAGHGAGGRGAFRPVGHAGETAIRFGLLPRAKARPGKQPFRWPAVPATPTLY